jgi:hypothetical protein
LAKVREAAKENPVGVEFDFPWSAVIFINAQLV